MAHHRVELVQTLDDRFQFLYRDAELAGDLRDVLLLGGQELMQRRIEEADGDRFALHRLVQALEVALLIGQDLGQRLLAVLDIVRNDHLAHRFDAGLFKKHVLGAAQANALSAELAALLRIARGVRIGEHLQLALLIRPAHEAAEVAGDGSGGGGDRLAVDVAGGAVDGDVVALVEGLSAQGEYFLLLVDINFAAAGHAAGAHAARDNRRVGGHAAANGQDALRDRHTLDILGGGFTANQDDLLALLGPLFGILSGEDDLAAGSARGSGEALADDLGGLHLGGVKLGMQQGVELLGLDAQNGGLLVDHALIHQVDRDFQRGGRGALTISGLQHEQLAVLDGELHILHILVVFLQTVGDRRELVVHLGHILFQMADGGGGTHAGDHVLALRVDQILAEQRLLAGGGIAGERNAGARTVTRVAEHHLLHVNGSAPVVGDLVHAAVDVRAGVIPGTEHGLDRFHQLDLRVAGEILALFLFVERFEADDQILHVVGIQLDVLFDALLGLLRVDDLLELRFRELHHDVGEHLDKTAVGVVSKAGVVGEFGKALHHLVVEAEVEDGIHHAGHGSTRARTDRNEQRVVGIGELFAADLFHLAQVLIDFGLNLIVDLSAVLVILGAGLGGHGKALRNRHAEVGHLGQVRTFTAEELSHRAVTLGEQVNVFFAHCNLPPEFCGSYTEPSMKNFIPCRPCGHGLKSFSVQNVTPTGK